MSFHRIPEDNLKEVGFNQMGSRSGADREWGWRRGSRVKNKESVREEASGRKSGRRQRTIQCVRHETGPVTGERVTSVLDRPDGGRADCDTSL